MYSPLYAYHLGLSIFSIFDCLYYWHKIASSLSSRLTSALVGCRYNQLHFRGLFGLSLTFLQISEARGGKSLRFRNFFTRPFAQTVPSSWIEKMKQTNIDRRSRYFSLVEVIILENWGLPAQIKRTQFISKAINLHLNRLHRTACAQSVFFGCFVYFSPLIFQHPLVVLSV